MKITEQIEVSQSEVMKMEKHYAGMELANEKQPTATIFKWMEKQWVCIGALSTGYTGVLRVFLRSVKPTSEYQGPEYNDNENDYTGMEFKHKGTSYRIEPYELEVHAIEHAEYKQESLL